MITSSQRSQHQKWLLEVTQIPTAAGKEWRVIDFIRRWVKERAGLAITEDKSGNLTVSIVGAKGTDIPPVYITAHLDHPAFVVERIVSPSCVELSFRGGVMDEYFINGKVAVWSSTNTRHAAVLTGETQAPPLNGGTSPFKHYLAELADSHDTTKGLEIGDVAVWDLPKAEVIDGILNTLGCDDLAAVAAALSAMDIILQYKETARDVRLIFTRAEEIGFIGAIAACKDGTMPKGSIVLALENSRSFPHDSPIGGGPIVRVGDRLTIFSPSLTESVAKCAESLAGGPAVPHAKDKVDKTRKWKWQRKLMAGGACEASVFCAAGYDATCICLPLGNYHNMGDLAAVQEGKNAAPPVIAPEQIAISDYEGLVDLLVACAQDPRVGSGGGSGGGSDGKSNPLGPGLRPASAVGPLVDKLWKERSFVLG